MRASTVVTKIGQAAVTISISATPRRAAAAIVRAVLAPEPVQVDRDVAWAALARDKKSVGGVPRLVLLEEAGRPSWGVEVPEHDVRAALDSLIRG